MSPQVLPTICPHSSQTFPLLPGTRTLCRMCGATLVASEREIANGTWPTPVAAANLNRVIDSEKAVAANYPGQLDAASLAAAAAL